MEGQKEQALIRTRAFCTASDHSLVFLSHMSICRKHFSRILQNLKTIYEYKCMKKADIGKHSLLLHKLGFSRKRRIYKLLLTLQTIKVIHAEL